MTENGDGVRLGRPPKEDRGGIVRNNGFSNSQWEWLEQEALIKGMDTMTYVRKYPIQWWIDSVEASRAGSVATQEDDEKFNQLTSKPNKSKKSRNHRTRRTKK